MTEKEAKTKWCPFSRYVLDAEGFASGNRFDGKSPDVACCCLGIGCMMWTVSNDMGGGCGLMVNGGVVNVYTREG